MRALFAPQSFSLRRTHARSVLGWLACLTNRRTDITTITAATCFQNVEVKMVRGRVGEGGGDAALGAPITSCDSLNWSPYTACLPICR